MNEGVASVGGLVADEVGLDGGDRFVVREAEPAGFHTPGLEFGIDGRRHWRARRSLDEEVQAGTPPVDGVDCGEGSGGGGEAGGGFAVPDEGQGFGLETMHDEEGRAEDSVIGFVPGGRGHGDGRLFECAEDAVLAADIVWGEDAVAALGAEDEGENRGNAVADDFKVEGDGVVACAGGHGADGGDADGLGGGQFGGGVGGEAFAPIHG